MDEYQKSSQEVKDLLKSIPKQFSDYNKFLIKLNIIMVLTIALVCELSVLFLFK